MVEAKTFPRSYRFEHRPVFGPPTDGTLYRLAAVCDDLGLVVWLDQHYQSGVHECHIVTDVMWAYFLIGDYTLETNVPSPRPERKLFRGTMWAWNSRVGGPPPARPAHLVPRQYGGVFPATKLDDVDRRRITKLVHPALDWWPKLYPTDQPVAPNPTKRVIDYGDLAQFL